MFDIIIKTLFGVFAIIGIIELIRTLIFWLLKTGNAGQFYLILSFQGHDEEAEISLRSAAERAKWIGRDVQVICVDRGMDHQTRQICEMVCLDNCDILLLSPGELEKYCRDKFANT